jgi:hypothetical protein
MATNYPALIVTFAREEGLQRLVSSGINSGIKRFYIAIDGPRTEEHRLSQVKMHDHLAKYNQVSELEFFVWQRTENLGAAAGVLTAINWFFSREKAGIILEDDLVPSSDFFTFAAKALDYYEHNPDVWVISGSRMLPSAPDNTSSDWSRYPMIWGWATWREKWQSMSSLVTTPDHLSVRNFFSARLNFWHTGARRAQAGLVDAWDTPLANAQFKNMKFTVIPPVNLVTNVGYDMEATHTSGAGYPLNHPVKTLPQDFQLLKSVSFENARLYDRVLEDQLFGIKFHHIFLGIYGPFLDLLKSRKQFRGSLNRRISQITLPN